MIVRVPIPDVRFQSPRPAGNQLLGEYSLAMGYRHSVTFQPLVNQLLDRCDLTSAMWNCLPLQQGWFTGIRSAGLGPGMAYAVGANMSLLTSSWHGRQARQGMLTAPILTRVADGLFISLPGPGAIDLKKHLVTEVSSGTFQPWTAQMKGSW